MRMKLLITSTALACTLSPFSSAWAQSAATDEASVDESAVITVMAQRRAQNLVDVPIAITAVDAERLENSQLNRVSDLPQMVTGLRIDANGSFGQPSIRGVGNSIAGTGYSNNVAIYVNGYYQPSQNTTDSMFLNLESVEVLKGPQGTLFGRNATGGAILMRLRKPSFTPSVDARLSYSKFDTREFAVYAATGFSDTLAADISFASEASDGYVKNIFTGSDKAGKYNNWAGRVSLLWNATDDISFELAYQHVKQDDARPYIYNVQKDPVTGQPMSLGALVPGGIATTKPGEVSYDLPNNFTANVDSVYLTSNFDIGATSLTSYTMYRDEKNFNILEQDSSSVRIFETIFGIRNKTFSQEFNLSGKSGSIDWLVGAFYYWNSADQEPFPFALGSVLTGGAPLEGELYYAYQDTSAWAVFADATAQLSDKWFLTLGARYSREKAKASWNINPVAQAALGIGLSVGATPGPSTPTTNSWGSFTPRVSLRHELDPDSSIYLTYSQGFKSGQLTPNAFVTTPLDPEKIKAFELGFRHVGQDLRFDASVYHYDYKGLQLAYFVNGTGVYRNAANSEIYGAEAQLTASLTKTLELNLGAAYTHAEYQDFPNAPSWAPTGAGTYAATNIDGSGFQMMRTPKFTANIGLRNETPLAGGVLALSGNYSYSSKFPFDAVGNFMEPAYGILNLRAAWKDPSERWEFAVFGTNVTNEKYRVQVLPADFAINQLWGKPAAYGISLSYKLR